MKSLQDILTEISKFENKALLKDCAHDDGFDDFLNTIYNRQAIIKSNSINESTKANDIIDINKKQ